MIDKLGQEITVGCKVIVVGGQGELQRMIVEKLGNRHIIKCRPTSEDSCAKIKKLFDKRANQSIVIDRLVKLIEEE